MYALAVFSLPTGRIFSPWHGVSCVNPELPKPYAMNLSKHLLKSVSAVGLVLVRVVSELGRDAVAWNKRRHELPWPDGCTAETIW